LGLNGDGKGEGEGLESFEDAIKRCMDVGYYIFNIGLLRLRTGYAEVFDSGWVLSFW